MTRAAAKAEPQMGSGHQADSTSQELHTPSACGAESSTCAGLCSPPYHLKQPKLPSFAPLCHGPSNCQAFTLVPSPWCPFVHFKTCSEAPTLRLSWSLSLGLTPLSELVPPTHPSGMLLPFELYPSPSPISAVARSELYLGSTHPCRVNTCVYCTRLLSWSTPISVSRLPQLPRHSSPSRARSANAGILQLP